MRSLLARRRGSSRLVRWERASARRSLRPSRYMRIAYFLASLNVITGHGPAAGREGQRRGRFSERPLGARRGRMNGRLAARGAGAGGEQLMAPWMWTEVSSVSTYTRLPSPSCSPPAPAPRTAGRPLIRPRRTPRGRPGGRPHRRPSPSQCSADTKNVDLVTGNYDIKIVEIVAGVEPEWACPLPLGI